MHLSFPEMVRTAPDAMRGLGATFGQADDAVECLVMMQAAFGKAYDLLREADSAGKSKPIVAPQISIRADKTVLDLHGETLLLMAARIADYVAAESENMLIIENGIGVWAMPYLMYRLATYGVYSVSVCSGRSDADSIMFASTPKRAGLPVFISADHATCMKALDLLEGDGSEYASGGASVILSDRNVHFEAWCTLIQQKVHCAQAIYFDKARAHAIESGFEVSPADLAFFQHLIARIRVPTNERSRLQAG